MLSRAGLGFLLVLISASAFAVEAPSAQIPLASNQVLRGNFVQESQMKGLDQPLRWSGHFVVAPAHGLIWGIDKPFPTSTIVTPKGSVQQIGGVTVKLPIKNLQHLYAMVGGALIGDWSGLEKDYVITPGGDAAHWHMVLTPRQPAKSPLAYTSIVVSGARFIESIVLTKGDGNSDVLSFTDEVLDQAPLNAEETVAFNQADKTIH